MAHTLPPEGAKALDLFKQTFGEVSDKDSLVYVYAPGRSEIAGNHTDHEGGHIIAGSLDVSIDAIARLNNTNTVRIKDAAFPLFEVSLNDLSVQEDEKETSQALVRGTAHEMVKTGREAKGFDLASVCSIPSGGGLSSSAAVEAAYGRAMETLWPGEAIEPIALAQMSQRTENNYFGKPCGLMDQAAVCLGSLSFMDFHDKGHVHFQKLNYDFEANGYSLCLVKVGSSHADLTADYAALPAEIQAVAHEFGKTRLCEVPQADFEAQVPALRKKLGDRAVLRAIHYYMENASVDKRWEALQANDIDRFLELTRASGASSAMFLQNVSPSNTDVKNQPAMVALGLAELTLNGKGATRIHGGGFGGTIQCFVPTEETDRFCAQMDAWLGAGSSKRYTITQRGAYAQWL
jgi:galactokinase